MITWQECIQLSGRVSSATDCKGVHDRSARGKQARQADFAQPERDLFLWAVLLNRRDLAKLFWKASKDHIGKAACDSSLCQGTGKPRWVFFQWSLYNILTEH